MVADSARAASAWPNTAAASQHRSEPSRLKPARIEPEVSIRIRVRPVSAGTCASAACNACSSGYAQRRLGAALNADRYRIGSTRDRATSAGSASRRATVSATSSLTPAVSKLRRLRRSARYPIDGMIDSQAAASSGPCRQPARDSQVMPAPASTAGSVTSRRRSTGRAISSRRRASMVSDSGTGLSRWWRRSSAWRKRSACTWSRATGWVRSSTSPKRTARSASYLRRLRWSYSRTAASAMPRLTGLDSVRPCRPSQ